MELEDLSPRIALPVGLLALLPVIWYGIGSSIVAGVVSAVNVVLILACLYFAFSPVEGGHHDSNGMSA